MLNGTESFIKSHFIDIPDSLISGDARRLREIYWRFLINESSEKFRSDRLTIGLENVLLCCEKLIAVIKVREFCRKFITKERKSS